MIDLLLGSLCALAIYHHVGFPVIMKMLKPVPPKLPKKTDNWPTITLIVPAYNEAKTIADKILNTACLDYPAGKLEMIIACDGCRDETYEVALQTSRKKCVAHLDINVMNFQENRGKVAVLNEVIARAKSDIVALSDSSSLISLDGLKRVAAHFDNEDVGVVGGTYHLVDDQNLSEDVYWKYQRAVKKGEAHFGAPMGMHGAFYAFRKKWAKKLPSNTINDDFTLPMKIVAQGYKSIYDDQIRCLETESTTHDMNWKRRVRISAGNLQQSIQCFDLLSLKHPGIAFCFFSGKFLRAWMALILASIFILTGWLSVDHQGYQVFLSLQVAGLGFALIPTSGKGKLAKLIQILRYLVIGHMAGFVGTVRYFSGMEKGAWKRAA